MKTKRRPFNKILIRLGVLILGALAVLSVSCNQQARSVAPQESAVARQSATPGQPLTRVPLTATGATATPGETAKPGTPATAFASTQPAQIGTPTATPTPTGEQLALAELQRRHTEGCDPSCQAARQAEGSYTEYGTPQQVSCPEWDALFPDTRLYLVPWVDHYKGEKEQRHDILALYKRHWYDAETFDQLLRVYDITITDDKRELVAKAFVLMTLAGYLDREVVFTDWQHGNWPARFGRSFNYSFTVWTKIQGLKTQWFFSFESNQFKFCRRMDSLYHVGDYIDVPFEILPMPRFTEFFFRE